MAAPHDDDPSSKERGKALLTGCGVLLACASLATLVLTDDPKRLRLAVVGALWAFLVVAITGRFRSKAEGTPGESDDELKRYYQMELQQEVAARREYELRLEVKLRRELEESRNSELEELRAEVRHLRAELVGLEAPNQQAALMAAAVRMNGMNGHHPRAALPAGFSDSPPPSETSPPFASIPVHADPEPSHPHRPMPSPSPVPTPAPSPAPVAAETFTPTEYIPAPAHGAGTHAEPHPSGDQYSRPPYQAAAAHGAPDAPRPGPGGRPASDSDAYAARESYVQEPYHAPKPYAAGAPAGGPEPSERSSDHTPSRAWSSYTSPTGQHPGSPESSYAGAPDPYGSGTAYGVASQSHPGYSPAPSPSPMPPPSPSPAPSPYPSPAAHGGAELEPYGGGGRHGAPSPEPSRSDPFDPSNTWPGAFRAGPAAAPQASRRAEAPAPSRGRHHAAGDEPEEGSGTSTQTRRRRGGSVRPEDDVLAQILGRW